MPPDKCSIDEERCLEPFSIIQVIPSPCAVVEYGRLIRANDAFKALYKATGTLEVEGRQAEELLPEYAPVSLREALSGRPSPCRERMDWEVTGAFPRSGIYACKMSLHPLVSARGAYLLWVVRDKTHESVFHDLSTVVLAFDQDDSFSITYVSSLIETWTGHPPESFYSNRDLFMSLVHPADRERVMRAFGTLLEGAPGARISYRLSHRDGLYRWVDHSMEFREPGPGNPAFFHGSLRDVTEEKERELALAEARERYSMIFQKAPLGILCMDRNGYVVDCNRQLCDLVGASRGSLLGLNTLTTHNLILRTIARNVLRGVDYHYEGPYLTDDAMGEIQVSIHATPLLDSGKAVIGGICLFQDIRKRLALEQSLRQERDFSKAVISSTGIAVVTTDINGTILNVNPALCRLTGYPDTELMGRCVWDALIPDKDAGYFHSEFEQALLAGKAGPMEASCKTRDKGTKIFSWTFAVLAGTAQGQDTVVLTGLDITSRHQLEEHLRRGQKMEAVGRLAGGVAHEFNNQLTSILGYCQILLQELGPDHPLYGRLKKIEKAARRSAETTKQLLAFSRKQSLLVEQVDLNPVILEGVDLFKQFLGEDIHVEVDLAQERLAVNVDRSQIQQILLNLALNARDAMPDGGTIKVETAKVYLNGDGPPGGDSLAPGYYALVSMEDRGHGMSPEVKEKAFEPFFTTKPVGKGAGLGLAMVYGTVKQSHGHVVIHSEQAKGTRVEIFLPLLIEGSECPEARLEAEVQGEFPSQVLLVEDDGLTRETVATVLRKLGYGVVSVATGEEALGVLKHMETPPDAILSDVVLPGMNGKVLVKRALEMFPDLKVIFMSGYPRDILEGEDEDVLDVPILMKPFTMERLAETLSAVLGKADSAI